jgi:hypothetical protein
MFTGFVVTANDARVAVVIIKEVVPAIDDVGSVAVIVAVTPAIEPLARPFTPVALVTVTVASEEVHVTD